MFEKSKLNLRVYGKELINHIFNLFHVCLDCHLTKPIPKLDEIEFCLLVGTEPKSKLGKERWLMFTPKMLQQKLEEIELMLKDHLEAVGYDRVRVYT